MPRLFLSDLHRMTREIGLRLHREISKPHGLSNQEAHMLTYLERYAPCPVSQIGSVFGIKRSTLTGMIDRLERVGYARRSLNPDDRRSFLVELTEEGSRVARVINRELDAFEEEIAVEAGEELCGQFHRFAEAVSRVCGSARDPGKLS